MEKFFGEKPYEKIDYKKPLLEKVEDNVSEYLFPLNSEEKKDLKEIIKELPETVIDFHCHSGLKETVEKEKIPETYGEIFLYREIGAMLMHRAILSGAITRQKPHKIYQVMMAFPFQGIDLKRANEGLLEETERRSSGFLPFLMPLPGEKGLKETKNALKTGSYFGIAEITPQLTTPRAIHLRGEQGYLSEEFLEIVNNQELPMTLHLPTHLLNHVEEIKKLSEDYPKIKIVLAHMGLVLFLSPRSKVAISEVATLPNVYFDTSTVTDKEVFVHVLKESGSEKILFASDAPYDALKLEVRFIEGKMEVVSNDLPGTEKVKEKIQRMLISSPKALLKAIEEVYPNEEQVKLAKENIFYKNALKILPRKLPLFNEEWKHKRDGVMITEKV